MKSLDDKNEPGNLRIRYEIIDDDGFEQNFTIIEGNAYSLSVLRDILDEMIKKQISSLHIEPFGAGSLYFDESSKVGIYIILQDTEGIIDQ